MAWQGQQGGGQGKPQNPYFVGNVYINVKDDGRVILSLRDDVGKLGKAISIYLPDEVQAVLKPFANQRGMAYEAKTKGGGGGGYQQQGGYQQGPPPQQQAPRQPGRQNFPPQQASTFAGDDCPF